MTGLASAFSFEKSPIYSVLVILRRKLIANIVNYLFGMRAQVEETLVRLGKCVVCVWMCRWGGSGEEGDINKGKGG